MTNQPKPAPAAEEQLCGIVQALDAAKIPTSEPIEARRHSRYLTTVVRVEKLIASNREKDAQLAQLRNEITFLSQECKRLGNALAEQVVSEDQLAEKDAKIADLEQQVAGYVMAADYGHDCDDQLFTELGVTLCDKHQRYCWAHVAAWLVANKRARDVQEMKLESKLRAISELLEEKLATFIGAGATWGHYVHKQSDVEALFSRIRSILDSK